MSLKSGGIKLSGVYRLVKAWVKEHLFEITIFFVISAIGTPVFFYKDNNLSYKATQERSFLVCKKISTQFIKQRCYDQVLELKLSKCPDFALNGNIEGCRTDMTSRYAGLRTKEKFPLKLLLYILLEGVLGLYFFYLKEKWSSW